MTRERWIDESMEHLDGWYAADTGSNGMEDETKTRLELAVALDVSQNLRAMTDKEAEIIVTYSEDENLNEVVPVKLAWPETNKALGLIYQ